MVAAWTELPPTGGLPECAALVQLAERLRWSAAELVIQYAERALTVSDAEGGPLAVRAQALVAAALVRLGRHADAVEPALAALRDADQAGVPELIPAIRMDLAACAHGLGESLLGCTILRPALETMGGRPSTRAVAITALVGCTAHVGRRDDLEDSLAEAERLLAADDALTPDARRMERAQLAMRTAAYYRRYGETEDAVEAARDGLGLLGKLRDPRLEGGLARAGLTLELVCALLDDGDLAEAARAAEVLLAEPVRAASAAAVGRLLLAMVTRVHVPAGRVERGRGLLGDAAWIAERHDHDWLLADAYTMLAQLDEASGQPADALRALRAARVAEQRQLRRVDAARRRLMIEFGARPMPVETVNSLLRGVVRAPMAVAPPPAAPVPLPPARPAAAPVSEPEAARVEPAETDEAGLLTREGLSRRIQAVRSANRPVALTLVRIDPVDGEGRAEEDAAAPDALATLAGRVRDIAPENAELARSDGGELAVLLPHTTKDEAEEFAATIRESAIEADWLAETTGHEVSLRTGVAQSGSVAGDDADALLSAARQTLTTAEPEHRAAADWSGPEEAERPVSEERPQRVEAAGTAEGAEIAGIAEGGKVAAEEPGAGVGQSPAAEQSPATERGLAAEWSPAAEWSSAAERGPAAEREQVAGREQAAGREDAGEREEAGEAEAEERTRPEAGSAAAAAERAPVAPEVASSEDLFLSTLEAVADEKGAGYQEIRSLLAPLLGHPSLRRGEPAPRPEPADRDLISPWKRTYTAAPPEPEPQPRLSWGGQPLQGSDTARLRAPVRPRDEPGEPRDEPGDEPTLPLQRTDYARRQTVPGEPEPDDVPEFPKPKPDIIVPKEPDGIPAAPGQEPPPEVPPPPKIPEQPERPEEPGPEEPGDLGPVHGPEPRPEDPPAPSLTRPLRRPERGETTSIAELLTEALVAYQETADEDDPPTKPRQEPVSHERMPDEHTESRPSGRHRMPDWDNGV